MESNSATSNDNQQELIKAEEYKKVIEEEKKYLGLTEPASGLAISGGGIRSASFGLGVMQALVADKKLSKIDYMSTVSGGGYLGSALTWALKQGGSEAGTEPDNFPLGSKGASAKPEDTEQAKPNALLDFIRQHSSYLLPVPELGAISFIAVVFRSIFLSLFVYTAVLTTAMAILSWFNVFHTVSIEFDFIQDWGTITFKGYLFPLCIGLFLLLLLGNLLYSLRTFGIGGTDKSYRAFINGQKVHGKIWMFIFPMLIIGILPYMEGIADQAGEKIATAGSTTLFGTLVGAWQYMKAQKNDNSSGFFSNLLIYLGAFALIFGLMYVSYLLATAGIDESLPMFLTVLFIALIFGIFVNLNTVGPHRIWRDRLMEAFLPNKDAVVHNVWQPSTEADGALMEKMCEEHPRPYHIINTNIILVDSATVKYRGRGGDNFIISRLYSGSDATGWRATKDFQKRNGRGITLATAMATSAAALNPNAGVSGEGLTRNSVVSILLSLLNLRLGYWTTNPKNEPSPFPPNFFIPGLLSELTRSNLEETKRNIQLSDGGHFENLGIYELVRRRAKLIIISDGGADPAFNFDDLANAVEKVRVDFGAFIWFEDNALNAILEGKPGGSVFDKKYNIAEKGYAIGKIAYKTEDGAEKEEGTVVYIKLAMIKNLPTDIYSYKGVNPTFPHQSTADQFFNEKQFEAYRELGYNVTKEMLKSEGKNLFNDAEKHNLHMKFRGTGLKKVVGKVTFKKDGAAYPDKHEIALLVDYPWEQESISAAFKHSLKKSFQYPGYEVDHVSDIME